LIFEKKFEDSGAFKDKIKIEFCNRLQNKWHHSLCHSLVQFVFYDGGKKMFLLVPTNKGENF